MTALSSGGRKVEPHRRRGAPPMRRMTAWPNPPGARATNTSSFTSLATTRATTSHTAWPARVANGTSRPRSGVL